MIEGPVEVSIPQALLEKILSSATPNAVLVGGQALAFWVARYSIALPHQFQVGAISDDADFLGSREDIQSIAKQTKGIPEYASKHSVTALVGQVKIHLSSTEFVNVDVLHRLVGPLADDVRARASAVTVGKAQFHVMHPLDVFLSRVENLSRLKEKQNPQGIEQTKLGVLVAHKFIEETATIPETGQKLALKLIEYVVKIAKSGAGHRITRDFGIDFRAGIPGYAIELQSFQEHRFPQILAELQPPVSAA